MRIRVWLKQPPARPAPGDRRAEPVTFGLPLPTGLVKDEHDWRLVSADGMVSQVQTRVMDRWHDDTARWMLVDARPSISAAAGNEYFLERGPVDAQFQAIRVSEGNPAEPGSVVVDTAAARFTLGPGNVFPFRRVERAGAAVIDPGASRLRIVDSAGVERIASVSSLEIEERGALRTVVLIRGEASAGGKHQTLNLTARVHFFAGLSTVRLLVTLTNPNRAVHKGGFWDLGDPGSILIKGALLTVAPATAAKAVQVSPELGAPATSHEPAFELYQDSSGGERWQSTNHLNREHRIATSFRGYRVRSRGGEGAGLRATPVVGFGQIAAAVPHFWQNFPRSIEASDSALTLGLFPVQSSDLHEIQGGEQKTYECFLSFGGDDVSALPLDWCRARTIASVDPGWVLSSGAVPFLAPLAPDHAQLVAAAVEDSDTFEHKREVIDQYGWRNFGEIYGDHESVRQKDPPIVSHYNNQYDPIAGFIYQFMRTADPRWWAMATELAAHVVDIDIYHTTHDKSAYNHGMFWHTYHYGDADTATHRTYPRAGLGHVHGGGPSADHNYTTGLMLHYFLTGDAASRQAVIGLGQFVIDLDDGRKTPFRWLDRGDTGWAIASATSYFGPGRGPANSLNALVDAHRLSGEPRFLGKAEQLVGRVIHPDEDIPRLRLDVPELRWFYTMFLQSLGKYLHHRVELQRVDEAYAYGRASLLHLARWMVQNEHPYFDKPEKLEFPTETWPAQDIRKSDVLHFAALHADPGERAVFTDKATYFYRYSIDQLGQMPTRTLARPVIVLLTSGYLHGWRSGHADAAEPVAGPVLAPPQTIFEPQRVRAERRAKRVAAALVVAGLIGVLALLI